MRRTAVLVGAVLCIQCMPATPMPDAPADVAAVRKSLDTWLRHMGSRTYDSLPALVTDDFAFMFEGKRHAISDLVTMIKGFNATEHTVALRNVVTRTSGDLGYLYYDADESLKVGGAVMNVEEAGSIAFRRTAAGWRMAVWSVSSVPPPPTK